MLASSHRNVLPRLHLNRFWSFKNFVVSGKNGGDLGKESCKDISHVIKEEIISFSIAVALIFMLKILVIYEKIS